MSRNRIQSNRMTVQEFAKLTEHNERTIRRHVALICQDEGDDGNCYGRLIGVPFSKMGQSIKFNRLIAEHLHGPKAGRP